MLKHKPFIKTNLMENIYFCFIDYTKAFDYLDHNRLWEILQEMRLPDHTDLPPEKFVCRSRSNS